MVVRQQLILVTVSEKTTNDQTLQEFAKKTQTGYWSIVLQFKYAKIWLLESRLDLCYLFIYAINYLLNSLNTR